jgi:hypothetical protein
VVLVIVALTSVTYLAMTLTPALGRGAPALRGGRAVGVTTAALALGAALLGLRVGGAGSGGELIPTLAVSVAAAAACGAGAAFTALGAGAVVGRLAEGQARRRAALAGARGQETRRLAASRRAYLEGADLRAEVEEADSALARLGAALDKLAGTHAAVVEQLVAVDDAAAAGDLGRELRRTRDEVATKLDLGRRIQGAARAAAFRLACTAPLRLLLRRRPRDLARGLGTDAGPETPKALAAASASIDDFLAGAVQAHGELAALEGRRPPPSDDLDERDEDAWGQAMRDLGAVEDAYRAVQARLGVLTMRFGARADMEEVASAAGEVSNKARASGIPASDLQGLVDEVTRAESAILMATPPELDARSLSQALSRGAAALGGSDGASLDELLRALREVV